MKRPPYYCYLFFLICFSTRMFAADASVTLEKQLSAIKTLSGQFQQITLDAKGQILQKSEGTLALAQPGKFRWETQKPIRQLIIANHRTLWIYDPDLMQVAIRPLTQSVPATPALLLSGDIISLKKDFFIQDNPDHTATILTPKNKEHLFQRIILIFKDKELFQMNITDHLDNITQIHFTHIKTNIPLKEALFIFRVPPHVDIIT